MWRTLKNAAIFDSDDEEKTDNDEMKQGTSAKGERTKRIVSGTKIQKSQEDDAKDD